MMLRPTYPSLPLRAVLVLGLALSAGCAGHGSRGYPGPERPIRDVARVTCDDRGSEFTVSIEKINGSESFHEFSGPTAHVDLVPGSYDLQLSAVRIQRILGGGMGTLISITHDIRNESRRTIPLRVEAGYAYHVSFNGYGEFYMVEPSPLSQRPPTPRELASRNPALYHCELAPTGLDRERCEAWMQEHAPEQVQR